MKHLGRGNFVLFSNSENISLFLSLNNEDSCHERHARLYIKCFISHYFHFLSFESKSHVKFCHKNFPLPIVSHYHWTRNRKRVTDEIWNPRACESLLIGYYGVHPWASTAPALIPPTLSTDQRCQPKNIEILEIINLPSQP